MDFFLLVSLLPTFADFMFPSTTTNFEFILFVLVVLLATAILLLMVKKLLVVMALLGANTTTRECADLPSKEKLVDFIKEALVSILITPCGLLHKLSTLHSSLNSLLLELLHLLLPVLVPTLSANTLLLLLPLLLKIFLGLPRLLHIFHSQNLLLSLLRLKKLNLANVHSSVGSLVKNADTHSMVDALSLTHLMNLFSSLSFSYSRRLSTTLTRTNKSFRISLTKSIVFSPLIKSRSSLKWTSLLLTKHISYLIPLTFRKLLKCGKFMLHVLGR